MIDLTDSLEQENFKEMINNKLGNKNCCDNSNKNLENDENFKEMNKIKKNLCFCKETKKYHHVHSEFCGHPHIVHNNHYDYIVDGYLHFPHEGHCDNHGKILIKETIF